MPTMPVPESVAIVGASTDRARFANKALRIYRELGARVFPIHPTEAKIEGIEAFRSLRDLPAPVELVLLYVRPEIGLVVLEDAAASGSRRVFLNPGTESDAIDAAIARLGLEARSGCAIVAVGKSPADY